MKKTHDIQQLIDIRRQLHRLAELSGKEKETAAFITENLKKSGPETILSNVGGHGVVGVFTSDQPGPVVLLRADTDALPIQETNLFAHQSANNGVAHLCGHDGHSTIMLGVAGRLHSRPHQKGTVLLLFQPAEETGAGAAAIIQDRQFGSFKIDYAYALHNLPGFPKGCAILKEGVFAAASVGLSITLKGRTAHASQPETGLSPAKALSELISAFIQYDAGLDKEKNYSLITITHARLGEQAFGTSPGEAILQATLRSFSNQALGKMQEDCHTTAFKIASSYQLEFSAEWVEAFPAVVNHPESLSILQDGLKSINHPHEMIHQPFRWSEDFGHFGSISKACLFGLGAGENHPALHNPDYDFPDEIIENGIDIFDALIRQLCE